MANNLKKHTVNVHSSARRNTQAKLCLKPLRAGDFILDYDQTIDPKQARADFDLALRYLQQDPHGAALLRRAHQSVGKDGKKLKVVLTSGDDAYIRSQHTVYWNPRSGLKLDANRIESPALGLMHEMVHAGDPKRYILKHREIFKGNDNPTSKDYNPDYKYYSEMERYAVEQTNIVAKGLGESDRRGYRANIDQDGENLNQKHIVGDVMHFSRLSHTVKNGNLIKTHTSQTLLSNNVIERTETVYNALTDKEFSSTKTVTDFDKGTITTSTTLFDGNGGKLDEPSPATTAPARIPCLPNKPRPTFKLPLTVLPPSCWISTATAYRLWRWPTAASGLI